MKIRSLALAAAALLLCGSVAEAATFSMTGTYTDQRGAIMLPLFGNPIDAPPGQTAMQTGAAVPGGGPATITIPTNALTDDANLAGFLIPVPMVIQLSTVFSHNGPTTSQTLMASRAGPHNFSYCPGATANPSCTTHVAGGTQGTLNGIVKYTAGANKFGGTFKMLLSGTGLLTNKGAALPPTVMTTMGGTVPALPFSAINPPLGGSAILAAGAGYAYMQTAMLIQATTSHPYGYMTTPLGLLTRGPQIGTGTGSANSNTGFPMTTGTVYLYRTIAAQAGGGDPPSKHTITGYDNRTAAGNGRIQLVSASLSRNYPSDGSDPPEGSVPNRSTLNMTFVAQPALPLTSPAMLLTLGSLVLLSAGYAVSRKRMN